jgi:predicted metal-dependent phosphoesterase TrpH
MYMERAGTADLHIHTTGSDGLATPAQVLDYAELRTNLGLIAITDHDDLAPSLAARELHARHGGYRFGVVTGMEVTTIEGHLIALFVEQRVPSFRSLPFTLNAIHAQGGLAIVPHPMSPLTRSIGRHGIERILRRRHDGLWFDGIETANPSPAGRIVGQRASALNAGRFQLSEIGGSDAHFAQTIGSVYTAFPGTTAAELHAAILSASTCVVAERHVSLREIGARQVLRQFAWAMTATPRKVVGRSAQRLWHSTAPARSRLGQP